MKLTVLFLVAILCACASTAPRDVVREAGQFMASYEEEIRTANRAALGARYDPRGSYVVFEGARTFVSQDAMVARYRDRWQPPATFAWDDLTYDAISRDAVMVLGGFRWGPPEGEPRTFSYTALLVRDPATGRLVIRLENEYERKGKP